MKPSPFLYGIGMVWSVWSGIQGMRTDRQTDRQICLYQNRDSVLQRITHTRDTIDRRQLTHLLRAFFYLVDCPVFFSPKFVKINFLVFFPLLNFTV